MITRTTSTSLDKNSERRMNKIVILGLVALLLLNGSIACSQEGSDDDTSLRSELNTELSSLVSRMHVLASTAGMRRSGQFIVTVFSVPQGEECDVVGSALCEGIDLLVSVKSLDLYGDHALHSIVGLRAWKFEEWTAFAEFDSPEHFASFEVTLDPAVPQARPRCGNSTGKNQDKIIVHINPWELRCEFAE